MKTKKIFVALMLTVIGVAFLNSCKTDTPDAPDVTIGTGVYVLNAGKFGNNNASITYYDFKTGFPSGDVFLDKNNRGLGDTGEDMVRYGSKIYVAVYKSSILEVIDAKTAKSVKSIPLANADGTARSPRTLTTAHGKVYIVLYDGHVTSLDTTSLTLGETITVGRNPDASVIANNKLYVANTGGMSEPKYDKTISVIDLAKFQEIKKIEVNLNPQAIDTDSKGNIFVISNGNYGDIPGKFQRIETGTDKVTDIEELKSAKGIAMEGDKAYLYSFDYDKSWQAINKKITVYNTANNTIISDNIIKTEVIKTPYCIDIDPVSKDIYLGVTDYRNNGKMYCFKNDGTYKFDFTVGLNPCKTIFIYNK